MPLPIHIIICKNQGNKDPGTCMLPQLTDHEVLSFLANLKSQSFNNKKLSDSILHTTLSLTDVSSSGESCACFLGLNLPEHNIKITMLRLDYLQEVEKIVAITYSDFHN